MSPRRPTISQYRGHNTARRLLFVFGVVLLAWMTGLIWFSAMLPAEVRDPARETDAIVVLTGGSGRVTQGLALLAEGRAKKLFVSGVYRGVDVQELLRVSQQ